MCYLYANVIHCKSYMMEVEHTCFILIHLTMTFNRSKTLRSGP